MRNFTSILDVKSARECAWELQVCECVCFLQKLHDFFFEKQLRRGRVLSDFIVEDTATYGGAIFS